MNTKDIRLSKDPDLAGPFDAILRAGQSTVDLAIQTNTEIVTLVNGKIVYRSAEQLKKERELNLIQMIQLFERWNHNQRFSGHKSVAQLGGFAPKHAVSEDGVANDDWQHHHHPVKDHQQGLW